MATVNDGQQVFSCTINAEGASQTLRSKVPSGLINALGGAAGEVLKFTVEGKGRNVKVVDVRIVRGKEANKLREVAHLQSRQPAKPKVKLTVPPVPKVTATVKPKKAAPANPKTIDPKKVKVGATKPSVVPPTKPQAQKSKAAPVNVLTKAVQKIGAGKTVKAAKKSGSKVVYETPAPVAKKVVPTVKKVVPTVVKKVVKK